MVAIRGKQQAAWMRWILAGAVALFCLALRLQVVIPVTAEGVQVQPAPEASADQITPNLQDFLASIDRSGPAHVAGVYAPGRFAYPVVQQPASNPGYVSSQADVVTQFRMAANFGTTAFLAHNTLSGQSFFDLQVGALIVVAYSDGSLHRYQITEIQRYQALNPTSPYSSFLALDGSQRVLSSKELFYQIYAPGGEQVVFQTCIAAEGIDSWGRLFVTAAPLKQPHNLSLLLDFVL